jgi:hypothetical protein
VTQPIIEVVTPGTGDFVEANVPADYTAGIVEVPGTDYAGVIEVPVATMSVVTTSVAAPQTYEVQVPGPQGPMGIQGPKGDTGPPSIFVGPTPPLNPVQDTLWLDTS